jgi:hypothetical protein
VGVGLAGVEGVVLPGLLGVGLGLGDEVPESSARAKSWGLAPELSSLRPEGRVPVPSGTEWVPLR